MNSIISASLSSSDVAAILRIPHSSLIDHMADMVPLGAMSIDRLTSSPRGGLRRDVPAMLDLADIVAVCVHLHVHPDEQRSLLRLWTAKQTDMISTRYSAEKEITRQVAAIAADHQRQASILLRAFGHDAKFIAALHAIKNGDIKTNFASFGIRAIAPDTIFIGTGTAYVTTRCDAIGATKVQLSQALRGLPGAKPAGARKFKGFDSRAIRVSASVLLDAITSNADER